MGIIGRMIFERFFSGRVAAVIPSTAVGRRTFARTDLARLRRKS
jgi:hypothetical protein